MVLKLHATYNSLDYSPACESSKVTILGAGHFGAALLAAGPWGTEAKVRKLGFIKSIARTMF